MGFPKNVTKKTPLKVKSQSHRSHVSENIVHAKMAHLTLYSIHMNIVNRQSNKILCCVSLTQSLYRSSVQIQNTCYEL